MQNKVKCAVIFLAVFHLAFCHGSKIMMILNEEATVAVANERFLSLGMDSNLIRDRWESFDFSSVRLKTLAKGLSPAFLRLMGTDGDRMVFVKGSERSHLGGGPPFPSNSFNFTENDWNKINMYV